MNNPYILPITIVATGALVAGAIFFAGKNSTGNSLGGDVPQKAKISAFDPATDHVLGNPNAPVKVIEYSDLECQYCKEFQTTMHRVMDYYGQSGQVAWVFRHLPLAQLHSRAPREAQAAECAAQLGGNEVFWNYVDTIYNITPSNNGLDPAELPRVAKELGLDEKAFNQCVESGNAAKKIQNSYNEAVASGAQGTPFIVITAGADSLVLQGSQPYSSMRAAIDAVLQNLPAASKTTTTE